MLTNWTPKLFGAVLPMAPTKAVTFPSQQSKSIFALHEAVKDETVEQPRWEVAQFAG